MSAIHELKNTIENLKENNLSKGDLEKLEKIHIQLQKDFSEMQAETSAMEIEIKGLKGAFQDAKIYLKKIINTVPDPIFVKNRAHRWVLLNDSFCRFMGVERQELLGKSDYDFFPKEQADVFWEKDEEVFTTGNENINEETITTVDGTTFDIVTKKSLFVESSGEEFLVGSIRDISEIKEAKLKKKRYFENVHFLSETAMEFVKLPLYEDIFEVIARNVQKLFGNSLVALLVYDPAEKALKPKVLLGFPQFRETFFKLTGVSIKEKKFIINEEGYERLTSGVLEEAKDGLYQLSMQAIPKQICRLIESIFSFRRFYGIGFSQKDSLLGSITIISKEKEELKNKELIEAYVKQASVAIQKWNTERALKNSEEKYRQIFENIQNVYYEVTIDGLLNEISPSVKNFTKYNREELIGKTIESFYFDKEERERFLGILEKYGKVQNYELKLKDKDGGELYSSTTSKLLYDFNGKPVKIIGSMIDITKIKKMNMELDRSQQRYKELVENIGEGVAIVNLNDIIEFANPAAERIFGVTSGKLINTNINDFVETKQFLKINESQRTKDNKRRGIYEITIKRPNGRNRNLIVTSTSRFSPQGEFLGSFLVIRDLTDKKKINEALRRSEERYRELFRNANDLVYTMDFEGNFTSVNPIAEKMLGYKFEDLKKRNMRYFITKESFERSMQNIKLKLKGINNQTKYDVEAIAKDGRRVFLEINSILRYRNGEPYEIFGIARDVTERKYAERKIKAALEEKEVLLKEIHHRVKNNLQVIISLINFQMEKDLPEDVIVNLRDLQDRVRSIALIHEDLYKTEDLARIDFKKYIQTLTANLFMVSSKLQKLECIINVTDVSLEIEDAIPCGMIINELVSNSLKYAFPENHHVKKPIITIDFQQIAHKKYQLTIQDNGIGFIPDISTTKKEGSLGLWLVNILVTDQLSGSIEFEKKNGTIARIIFGH